MNREWVEKDFYKTLGVTKNASDSDIKKAYRQLAQKNHPDTNPGDEAAEARFKEVSEAYATLSNAEKRKEYDQVRQMVDSGAFTGGPGGPGGFGGFGNGQRVRVEDLSDLFGGGLGDLFGGFGGGNSRATSRAPRRGADVTATLNISFEDAIRGVTTTVAVDGDAACRTCRGSGAEPGTSVDVCPTCAGAGTVAANQGVFSFSNPCPQCRGRGHIVANPCAQCRGTGRERRVRNIKVKIPAGVRDGATIRVPGKGGPGSNGGPAGDLIVRLKVAPHVFFGRKRNDLTLRLPITFTEAALGAKVEVPTLDGPVTLRIPAGTSSGKTFRVPKKGVPRARGRQGNLLVTVEVTVPDKLPREAKQMLEEFKAQYETEDPRAHLKV
ncbi:MAG: molecular chaperone DnaJ [Acidimicrobiia bacterium]|nr:molecular chaperone DnaJ [Acidimicrobiia bacterium]